MGLPNVNIEFSSKATAAIKQGTVGVLALALKDTSVTSGVKQFDITSIADVPSSLSAVNEEYVQNAFAGTPKMVKVVVISDQAADFSDALNRLESISFDTVAFPGATSDDMGGLASWVKSMRDTKDKKNHFDSCKYCWRS